MRGWAGPATCPLPPAPLAELLRGEGDGGMAGRVQPGDFEHGRGDLWQASRELKWQVFLASKWLVILAGEYSRLPWQDILADHFGGSFWRVILAHLFGRFS